MEIDLGLALFVLLVALYGGVGVLLGRWSITLPMVFVTAGVALGPYGFGLIPLALTSEAVKLLAELTLVILLFADASTLSFTQVKADAGLPVRLLGIGMPLTLALGALVATLLFPREGLGFALLVASILAPTDAALGLPIFANPKVPVRIRRALNVESGLNDGIATPFVTLFLSLMLAEERQGPMHWLLSAAIQLGIGLIVGTLVGVLGGRMLHAAHRRGWTAGSSLQVAVLALAMASYFCAVGMGGNGFVAAFVGGIAFGVGSRDALTEFAEFSETTGTVLSLAVWASFGALFVVPAALDAPDPRAILYALGSLTVIRMLPVFFGLRRFGLRHDTLLLMGWFGPRGLASVVFGVLAVEELIQAGQVVDVLASVVTWTILLSVLAHGLSAQPLADWYARRLAAQCGELPELREVPEVVRRVSPNPFR